MVSLYYIVKKEEQEEEADAAAAAVQSVHLVTQLFTQCIDFYWLFVKQYSNSNNNNNKIIQWNHHKDNCIK